MGTGHTIDTPLRVAKWGISSVVSLVDDILIEQVHRLHSLRLGEDFRPVSASDPKARALRITRYLDFIQAQVERQMAEMRSGSFEPGSDKVRWFELLPESSPLKREYREMSRLPAGPERRTAQADLSAKMEPGSIDVNIMTKLDRRPYDRQGQLAPSTHSDAKLALEGFAMSRVSGNLVFSAGMNPSLFTFAEGFDCFYRQGDRDAEKGLILKVTDFRSASTQGRVLAKKGLEVREFRIESGINCGGHSFASDGDLLAPIVARFAEQREEFSAELARLTKAAYLRKGLSWSDAAQEHRPALVVQGGLGNAAEHRRMIEDFGVDATGWGSPFLLVPEATPVDARTRGILAKAKASDIRMTDSSPLGVKLKNLEASTAVIHRRIRFEAGIPGSSCPKGYLVNNTEFGERPLCTASREYLERKIEQIGGVSAPGARELAEKECICHQLGNGALEFLRQENAAILGEPAPSPSNAPVSIIPGPNIGWFDRDYTLDEMVGHIYGRIPSLVPPHRPHVFAYEIEMYLELFETRRSRCHPENTEQDRELEAFRRHFGKNVAWLRDWVQDREPLEGENLASLLETLSRAERILGLERPVATVA